MIAWTAILASLCGTAGCGLGPKTFRSIRHPAPLMRARSIGLGERLPAAQAVPLLLERLDDPDPVVRLAAHEELKRRTGQDFGYIPWDEKEQRSVAISRWRNWLGGGVRATPQVQPQVARRNRRLASPQSPTVSRQITLPPPPSTPSGQQ